MGLGDVSWEKYAPPAGGFEVSFLKKPDVKDASSATGNFNVAANPRVGADDVGFICQWKLKDKASEKKAADILYLRGQRTGIVNGVKGKLIEEKEIKCGEFQGLEFVVQASNATLRCRAYVSGKRIVTLMVVGKDADAVRTDDAKKFLDSFKESK
jgi:hypothetical protein